MMPERNCSKCTTRQKQEWGCTATYTVADDGERIWTNGAAIPLSWEDGEDWFACPRQDIHQHPQEWSRMLLFYGMYSKGFMPDEGGVAGQSHYAVEVFRIFDNANAQADEALAAEQRRKQSRS